MAIATIKDVEYNGQKRDIQVDIDPSKANDQKYIDSITNQYVSTHPQEFALPAKSTKSSDTRSTFRKFVDYPGEGANRAIKGAGEFLKNPSLHSANEVMEGGFQAMTPFALPALAIAPEALALGAIGSGVGTGVGEGIGKLTDASPDAREFMGNVGGITGGMFGSSSPKVLMGSRGAADAMMNVAKQPNITGGLLKRSIPGILGSLGGAITGDYHNILRYGAAGELLGAAAPYLGAAVKGAYEGGKGYPWLPATPPFFGPKQIGDDSVSHQPEIPSSTSLTKPITINRDRIFNMPPGGSATVDQPQGALPPVIPPMQQSGKGLPAGQTPPQLPAGPTPIITPEPQAPKQITGPSGGVTRTKGAIPLGPGKSPQEGSNTPIPQNRGKGGKFSALVKKPTTSGKEMMENVTKGKKTTPKEIEPKKGTESKSPKTDGKVLKGDAAFKVANEIAQESGSPLKDVIDFMKSQGHEVEMPKTGKKSFGGAKPLAA